ncbi:MAG: glycosyltransferase family 2 protein [Devosia sp.]
MTEPATHAASAASVLDGFCPDTALSGKIVREGDRLVFPPSEASITFAVRRPVGVHKLVIVLAAPAALRVEVGLGETRVRLPKVEDGARFTCRFAVDAPITGLTIAGVESGTIDVRHLSLEPATPWAALLPDRVFGPLRLPPLESLVAGDPSPILADGEKVEGWSRRITVADRQSAVRDGTRFVVEEPNGAVRLTFDPPLPAGWCWIGARVREENGAPTDARPRLFPCKGWHLPAVPGVPLRPHHRGPHHAHLRLKAPTDSLLLRPRALPGAVVIESLHVSPQPILGWVRAGLRVMREHVGRYTDGAVHAIGKRLPEGPAWAALLAAFTERRNRRHRRFVRRHEAEAIARWLARPVVREGTITVAVGYGPHRARTLASLDACGDPSLHLAEDETADIALPAGATLAPHAIAALRRTDADLVTADEDRKVLGVRTAPRLYGPFDRERALSRGAVPGLFFLRNAGPSALTNALAAAKSEHIPLVLIHHRSAPSLGHEASESAAIGEILGKAAQGCTVRAHRQGFRVVGPTPQTASIVVATRDAPQHLERFLKSVKLTRGLAYEILLVDNGTEDPAALTLLADAVQTGQARVMRDDRPFNFAALNNLGARAATGDLLVFANNDVSFTDPDWLVTLAQTATRPDIGIAGAKLLYPDGTVQHSGLVLAADGAVRHLERGIAGDDPGYLSRQTHIGTVSAVTGALFAMRADLFRAVGGFDARRFPVLCNDVDLCLRVAEAGHRIVVTPDVVALHHESASIGPAVHNSPVGRGGPFWLDRGARETAYVTKGRSAMFQSDPHYPQTCEALTASFLPHG